MIKYMKDPFNKEETAYDYFKKNSNINITPGSNIKEINKIYKKILEKYPEEFYKIREMWDICNTIPKRLKMDFFYYIINWNK